MVIVRGDDRPATPNQTERTMNASEIHFGVEIETTLPNSDTTPIGPYHSGYQVPWLPTGWKAERDTSIKPTTLTRKGCEFVSPKLKGEAGLAEVEAALEAINARGAKVNPTCGVHVSVEWNGDASALARLISLVGNHEKAIFASTGTRRREIGTYTKPVKAYANKDQAKQRCESDRYHLLNLTHLARGRNRIEIRAFAGTTNATKLLGYIMMVIGLVELAQATTRCSSWNYEKPVHKKSCWDRPGAGVGETELNRLFYRLNWTKGWYKNELKTRTFGVAGTRDMKAIKTKLLEMARKYDRS